MLWTASLLVKGSSSTGRLSTPSSQSFCVLKKKKKAPDYHTETLNNSKSGKEGPPGRSIVEERCKAADRRLPRKSRGTDTACQDVLIPVCALFYSPKKGATA